MNKLLEIYNLPKQNHGKVENLNRPVTSKKIKLIIKNMPTKKSPGQDCFTIKFYQMFKYELMSMLLKLFQKLKWV